MVIPRKILYVKCAKILSILRLISIKFNGMVEIVRKKTEIVRISKKGNSTHKNHH